MMKQDDRLVDGSLFMIDEVKIFIFTVIPIIQDALLVFLFFWGLHLKMKRKTVKQPRFISLHPVLLWVGAVCGGILSIPVTLVGANEMPSGVWYLFEACILGCIIMMLAYCNNTITYDETRFEVSGLFGKKRTYEYREITRIFHKGDDAILCCGRERIRVDAMFIDGTEFISYADKMYYPA